MAIEEAVQAFGKLEKPAFLKGEALKAWKLMIEPAGWVEARGGDCLL